MSLTIHLVIGIVRNWGVFRNRALYLTVHILYIGDAHSCKAAIELYVMLGNAADAQMQLWMASVPVS